MWCILCAFVYDTQGCWLRCCLQAKPFADSQNGGVTTNGELGSATSGALTGIDGGAIDDAMTKRSGANVPTAVTFASGFAGGNGGH
jgi:hypothetical protein